MAAPSSTRLARLCRAVEEALAKSARHPDLAVRERARIAAYRWTFAKDLAL